MDRTTLVLGASLKSSRYSYKAIHSLRANNENVVAVGLREGEVCGVQIQKEIPDVKVHTVTLYLGPSRQESYIDQIIQLRPERVIFNPGTENPVFFHRLEENGIEYVIGCTLVMLSIGNY